MDRRSAFDTLSIPAPLPSEYTILSHRGTLPKRDGAKYLQVVEEAGEVRVFNPTKDNAKPVQTRRVTASGLVVVIDDDDDHPLWKRLDDKPDIEQLTVCADEIVIRRPLRLPGTRVVLRARYLRFEGEGVIDTSPRPFEVDAASTDEWAQRGADAGSIHLYVKEFEPGGSIVRFIANGADGLRARAGEWGGKGRDANEWDGKVKTATLWGGREELNWATELETQVGNGYSAIRVVIQEYTMTGGKMAEWVTIGSPETHGEKEWPEDGKPPKKMPGHPGLGGSGGTIYSRFSAGMAQYSEQRAGRPGAKAADLPVAPAGEPVKSCSVKVGYKRGAAPHLMGGKSKGNGILNRKLPDRFEVAETHIAKEYPAVRAPEPATSGGGTDGARRGIEMGNGAFWLDPLAVEALIGYLRDAFRAGQDTSLSLRRLVDEYLDALAEADGSVELALLRSELVDLLQRIDGPLDYFGYPAGWVPALSFQSNLAAFRKETEEAMARLYLSYWMEHNQAGKAARVRTIETTLERLREESREAAASYDGAVERLVVLKSDYGALKTRIEEMLARLRILEEDEERLAAATLQAQKFWRAAGKILGGVAQVIPVGQPALGAVGKGLGALADFDPEEPFDSVMKVGSAVWDSRLVDDVLLPKVKEKAMKLFDIAEGEKDEFTEEVDKEKYKEKVKKHINEQSAAKDQVVKALGSLSVSRDEIDAAVQKALAESPAYAEVEEALTALNEEKARFAQSLLAVVQQLDEAAGTLVANRLTEIELRAGLDSTLAALSPEGLRFTRAMGERALERLRRYEYYFVKSYLYLWLRPPSSFDADTEYLFKELKRVLQPKEEAVLSGENFDRLRVVFEKNLKAIADEVFTYYNTVLPGSQGVSTRSRFTLELNERQLAALNGAEKRVVINPVREGKVLPDLEDVRLFEVKVSHAELIDPPAEAVDVRVRIKHPGESTLRRDGRLYLFRATDRTWGSVVTHQGGAIDIAHEAPDPMDESLIRHLLGNEASRSPLRSRPSAWSPLVVERELKDARSRYPAQFRALTLEVVYTARDVDARYVSLFVSVPGEVQPLIGCSARDVNERGDGEGSFMRTFLKGTRVRLSAPADYGRHAFLGWLFRDSEVGNDPTRPMPLLTPEAAESLREGDVDNLVRERELELKLDAQRFVFVEAIYLQRAG